MSAVELIDLFNKAKLFVIEKGFQYEINACDNRYFNTRTAKDFLNEYAYVVLNTGMKNQVAEKMFKRLFTEGIDSVHHKYKREAIDWMQNNYESVFKELNDNKTDNEKITFLETLPFIGKITKYHLARNLGIDCAKPDRHLERMALRFGFIDAIEMCGFVSRQLGIRIGTVDVILWRYSNLTGTK